MRLLLELHHRRPERRPPRYTAFFFTDPEGRRWFRTGDYGMIDVAGFLYVQRRVKDLVKRASVSSTPAA